MEPLKPHLFWTTSAPVPGLRIGIDGRSTPPLPKNKYYVFVICCHVFHFLPWKHKELVRNDFVRSRFWSSFLEKDHMSSCRECNDAPKSLLTCFDGGWLNFVNLAGWNHEPLLMDEILNQWIIIRYHEYPTQYSVLSVLNHPKRLGSLLVNELCNIVPYKHCLNWTNFDMTFTHDIWVQDSCSQWSFSHHDHTSPLSYFTIIDAIRFTIFTCTFMRYPPFSCPLFHIIRIQKLSPHACLRTYIALIYSLFVGLHIVVVRFITKVWRHASVRS